jgi:hypothetical protein
MEQPKANTSCDSRDSQKVVQVGGEWLRVGIKATIGLSRGQRRVLATGKWCGEAAQRAAAQGSNLGRMWVVRFR